MKIAFLGTPDFALPSLKMLHERGDDVVVFTQPDKPVGRKAVMTPPPVKKAALEYGMKVYQFDKIKSEEGVAALKAESPELMVTAAFGQILSRENLAVPKCARQSAAQIPRSRADTMGCDKRRKDNRRYHHAYGYWAGYGRHFAEERN